MKIAQIAPTWYRLPPKKYGGIERIVSELTEELVKRGHDVTLFASKDSQTSAKLYPSLFDAPGNVWISQRNDYMYSFSKAVELQDQFDLLHFHAGIDIVPHILARYCRKPYLLTYHNHNVHLNPYYEDYKDIPVVSISNDCRKMFPSGTNFIGTVYNGTPIEEYRMAHGGKKFAFLGAVSNEKGAREAIDIAVAGNWEIEMAAKVDVAFKPYFDEKIKPMLNDKVRFIGEVDTEGKNELLGNARALLFPINWEEPFGLVMIEAMACGTPVIAFDRGSVKEVLVDGETGFIVPAGDIKAAVLAAKKIQDMPENDYQEMRRKSRKRVEDLFSVPKMVDGYEALYSKLASSKTRKPFWLGK